MTETKAERKQAWEWVTTRDGRGCRDSVEIAPEKDGVYLLDYSNLNIDRDCTVQAYQQVSIAGGSFKLTAVGG
ncbi:MAG: hypothetical protein V3S64_00815, partial [bacterium]